MLLNTRHLIDLPDWGPSVAAQPQEVPLPDQSSRLEIISSCSTKDTFPMDSHQRLKQRYLQTQRASHSEWLEEQTRHSVQRTTPLQHRDPINLYNHKDPDKISDNPSSKSQSRSGPSTNSSRPNLGVADYFIAPDGTQINTVSSADNIAMLADSSPGYTTFSQTVGTKTKAEDYHFIAFTNLEELERPGRWILGQILTPSTSRKRAATSKYSENWHNFTLLKVLSGPNDWQALASSNRCINLKLGANWCMVQLNVPIEELDVTITTPVGQPSPNAISPPRPVP